MLHGMIIDSVSAYIVQESRFTKCDTCTMIKREKEKTFNEVKLKELDRMLQEHNALQMLVSSLVYVYCLNLYCMFVDR